jgi:hypothetical protein
MPGEAFSEQTPIIQLMIWREGELRRNRLPLIENSLGENIVYVYVDPIKDEPLHRYKP